MMRCGDIRQGARPTELDVTPGLYIRTHPDHEIPIEEHTLSDLHRGLCARSGGHVDVCKTCAGGCRWGKELLRRMEVVAD